jgi:hypothetical protein
MNEHSDAFPRLDRAQLTDPLSDEQLEQIEMQLRLRASGHLVRLEYDAHRLLEILPSSYTQVRIQLRHAAKIAPPLADLLISPLINGGR